MAADFVIRQGDTYPALQYALTDSTGTPLNLAGASVKFVMRQLTAATPVVNAAATVVSGNTVQYTFSATDTQTAGLYTAEFHVTFSDSTTTTAPADGYLEISVEENLTTAGGATIVSLGEVREHLQISASDKVRDSQLIRFIRASVPVIEGLAGDVVAHTRDEWYDGGQWFIRPRHRPVLNLLACSMFLGPVEYTMEVVDDPTQGSIYSVMLDQAGRITRRITGGGVTAFPAGPDTIHVVYTTGLTTVPENIRQANLELLRVNYQGTQQRAGGAAGWGTATANPDDDLMPTVPTGFYVPGRVREMLAPNRRAPSVA